MRIETSAMARAHMKYLKEDAVRASGLQAYNSVADHFYNYLITVQGLLPDTARVIVDDFQSDLERQ